MLTVKKYNDVWIFVESRNSRVREIKRNTNAFPQMWISINLLYFYDFLLFILLLKFPIIANSTIDNYNKINEDYYVQDGANFMWVFKAYCHYFWIRIGILNKMSVKSSKSDKCWCILHRLAKFTSEWLLNSVSVWVQ